MARGVPFKVAMNAHPRRLILLAALVPALVPALPAVAAVAAAAQLGIGDDYDDDIDVRTGNDDFENRNAIDPDERRLNQAQARKVQAEEQIEDAVRRVRATWQADPEYVETKTKLDDLQRQVNEARREARDELKREDADYLELSQVAEELDGRLETRNALEDAGLNPDGSEPVDTGTEEADAPADPNAGGAGTGGINVDLDEEDADSYKDDPQVDPERLRLAQQRLKVETRMAEFEEQAYQNRPGYGETLAELEDVRLEMKKQQAELDKLLYQDSGYKQAQEQLARAKAGIAAAGR